MTYGNKRNYKKINIYLKKTGKYICSTTWAKSCKEAIEHFGTYETANGNIYSKDEVKASYK